MYKFILGLILGLILTLNNSTAEAAVSSLSATTFSDTDASIVVNITSNVAISTTTQLASKQLVGQDKQNPDMLASKMTELLQLLADTIQPLTDLPDDDPDKTIDPGLNCIFWDNVNGVDVLRSRGPLITITFNEAGQYVPSAARCVN